MRRMNASFCSSVRQMPAPSTRAAVKVERPTGRTTLRAARSVLSGGRSTSRGVKSLQSRDGGGDEALREVWTNQDARRIPQERVQP